MSGSESCLVTLMVSIEIKYISIITCLQTMFFVVICQSFEFLVDLLTIFLEKREMD